MWPLLVLAGIAAYYFTASDKKEEKVLTPDMKPCLDKVNLYLDTIKAGSEDKWKIIKGAMKSDEGLEVIAQSLDKAGQPEMAMCFRQLKGYGNNL